VTGARLAIFAISSELAEATLPRGRNGKNGKPGTQNHEEALEQSTREKNNDFSSSAFNVGAGRDPVTRRGT
jgi:hypothetical protein